MKIKYFAIALLISFSSCKNNTEDKLATITPGLGEYMAMIEYHHDNLSKAINKQNYKRADYEIDELYEVFEIAEKVHNNHEKLKQPLNETLPGFMYAPLNLLRKQLKIKDSLAIKNQFKNVTINCNACHAANGMEFIEIED